MPPGGYLDCLALAVTDIASVAFALFATCSSERAVFR
jgi:hypothetical protein